MFEKYKSIIYLVISIILLLLISGLLYIAIVKNISNNEEEIIMFKSILPEDAKKMIDSGEELIILDVRTKEEYDEGHIENSILIPLDELEEKVEESIQNKDIAILVYCRSGIRSAEAASLLFDMKYTKVYNLGGIINWPYGLIKD